LTPLDPPVAEDPAPTTPDPVRPDPAKYTYGPIPLGLLATRPGIDLLRGMITGDVPAPPIARTMHMWLDSVSDGLAVFLAEPAEDLFNPLGTIHGGWVLTLIDSACGCASHSTLPAGVGYTSLETKVNMVRAILPSTGIVRIEGKVLARGRQILTAEAKVTDRRGRLLAHGTSTLIVLRPGRPE
jgi:uncharacterized protein (TIGR00369 family)